MSSFWVSFSLTFYYSHLLLWMLRPIDQSDATSIDVKVSIIVYGATPIWTLATMYIIVFLDLEGITFVAKGMPTWRGIKLVTKNIDVMKHGVWIHAWLMRIRENSKDSIAHYEMFKASPLVFTISHFYLFAKSTWGRLHMTW